MTYQVKLDVFEGPLDLLLHLIKKNEVSIYDIPIALITQQYLEYLDLMTVLNLEVAGEFVVMAATLLHIKSRMLLPVPPDEEEPEEDPRAELARRLLEYERFKAAAQRLDGLTLLDRDVFARKFPAPEVQVLADAGVEWEEVELFDLLTALRRVLEAHPTERVHEVAAEELSVRERLVQVLERLQEVGPLSFEALFLPVTRRAEVIVSFLAVLELIRLKLVKVYQVAPFGAIRILPAVTDGSLLEAFERMESIEYRSDQADH
ncbi:MAG: segregation/condensation protein A [Deltaproteobacteria bacterium]|nr:segregation/condensation protein A [Deltaproteobacteria bacterium]